MVESDTRRFLALVGLTIAVLAAIGATTIAATVGTVALLAGGIAFPRDAGSIWLTWWLGDTVGALLIPPIVLLWRRPSPVTQTTPSLLERRRRRPDDRRR